MRVLGLALLLFFMSNVAFAQSIDLGEILQQDQNTYAGRIVQGLILLTVLSLAPGLLITTT